MIGGGRPRFYESCQREFTSKVTCAGRREKVEGGRRNAAVAPQCIARLPVALWDYSCIAGLQDIKKARCRGPFMQKMSVSYLYWGIRLWANSTIFLIPSSGRFPFLKAAITSGSLFSISSRKCSSNSFTRFTGTSLMIPLVPR